MCPMNCRAAKTVYNFLIQDLFISSTKNKKQKKATTLRAQKSCPTVNKGTNSNIWFVKQFNLCTYIGGKCRNYRGNDPPRSKYPK